MNESPRTDLLDIFHSALRAVNGRNAVREYLQTHPIAEKVYLVAIGKAAASMALGAQDVLGEKIIDALVITKTGHCDQDLPFACLEAGHPVPNEASLDAGRSLLSFIDNMPAEATIVFLISGGASALVEVLPNGVGLQDLRRVNDWLLASGLDIAQMNLWKVA